MSAKAIKGYTYEATNGALTQSLRDQLALLLSTPIGTVVLDRDFGIDFSFIDQPLPIAQNMLAAELAVKIPRYIPELDLKEIILTQADVDGNLYLKVVVEIVQ